MDTSLTCSVCRVTVGRFRKLPKGVIYTTLHDDHYLLDPEFTDEAWRLRDDPKALHWYLQTVRADQVSQDGSTRYATGQNLEHGIDSYCPACDKLYCKTHYDVQYAGASGYGGVGVGTCPEGHQRELFSDYMSC